MKELTKTAAGTLLLVGIFTACSPLASSVSKHGTGGGTDSNRQNSKSLPNTPDPTFTNTSAPAPSPSPTASSTSGVSNLQSGLVVSMSESNQRLDFADRAEIEMTFIDIEHESLTPEEFQSLKSRDSVEISKSFNHVTVEVDEQDLDDSPDGLKFLIRKKLNGRFELALDTQSPSEAVTWFKARAVAVHLH